MGFFSKLLDGLLGSNKTSADPLDSDGKPREWFFSEDGKESFLRAKKNYSVMKEVIEERGYHDAVGDACGGTTQPRKEKALNWPCRYFWNYLKASGARFQNCAVDSIQTLELYFLSDITCDEAGGDIIPYPDFLYKEKNPLLNFILNCDQKYITYVNKDMVSYVYKAFCKDLNTSEEAWLYDRSIFFNEQNKQRPDEKIKQLMLKNAKYPELLEE